MKIGLQIFEFDWPGNPGNIGGKLSDIAKAADEGGLASLWTMDHLFQMDMPDLGVSPEEPMLESYATLGYLASVTKRVRLGSLVTGVIYRNPGLLIKTVTTLDVLSGGRAYLGIGAAWYEREAVGLGYAFPDLGERMERLEETLRIAKLMWSGKTEPYEGKHYHLPEPMNNPPPLSGPHPPILVGGVGEKKTLRLVARYADACNLYAPPFIGWDDLRRKLDVLKRHCDEVGRPYEEIERTAIGVIKLGEGGMSVSEFIGHCRKLADEGIQHLILGMPDTHEIKPIELIAREIIPEVAGF